MTRDGAVNQKNKVYLTTSKTGKQEDYQVKFI